MRAFKLNDTWGAPVPRGIRRLVSEHWLPRTQNELVQASGVGSLSVILNGHEVPTIDQIRRLCRAMGISAWKRALAFMVLWEDTDAARQYRKLPGYGALEDQANCYVETVPGRTPKTTSLARGSGVSSRWLLHRKGPEVHSIACVFERSREKLIVAAGDLGLVSDDDRFGGHYKSNYSSEDPSIYLQFDPIFPKMPAARLWIADVSEVGVADIVKRIIGHVGGFVSSERRLRFSRVDIFIDIENDLSTLDLVPSRRQGQRRRFGPRLQQWYGPKNSPFFAYYDNEHRGGGTRLEYRFKREDSAPQSILQSAIPHHKLAQLPNPWIDVIQFDLREDDIVDRELRDAVLRAQEAGALYLLRHGRDVPTVLRGRKTRHGRRKPSRLMVANDPSHPRNLWDAAWPGVAVGQLADRLGLAHQELGLSDKTNATSSAQLGEEEE